MDGPANISGILILVDGIIATTSTNLLTLESGSGAFAASNTSHIDGPLKKIGNTDFEFPVGDNGIWAPAKVANLTGGAASEFTATYFANIHSNTTSLKTSDPNGDLNNVSRLEYWDISNTGTASNADVTLFWKNQSRSNITDYGDLVIAHYTGTEWENLSKTSIVSGDPGSITINGVSSFSPFTFGSPTGDNPLPVELIEFKAKTENHWLV